MVKILESIWNRNRSRSCNNHKFSYLKELVTPKVRALINVLPFNTERCKRTKTILKAKFGKSSEVTNTHIQSMMSLPTVTQNSAGKIHDFDKKLVTYCQALGTMAKLKDINEYVRLALDKLTIISANLVRRDDDWQEWDFW